MGASNSGTRHSEVTVRVHINDVNEAPSVAAGQVLSVDENTVLLQTLASAVTASDPDSRNTNFNAVTLEVTQVRNGNTNGVISWPFDRSMYNNKLKVTKNIDYESKTTCPPNSICGVTQFKVYVRAKDNAGATSATEFVTVNVNDVNEKPVIRSGQTFNISENVGATSLGTIIIDDEDSGSSYSLTVTGDGAKSTIDATGVEKTDFAVGINDGALTSTSDNQINFENKGVYTVDVSLPTVWCVCGGCVLCVIQLTFSPS